MNLKDVDGNPQVMLVFIDYSTGKINARIFTTGTTSTQIGASDVRDGKWHHVAIVYDGGTGEHSLYVDGKLEATETGSGAVYLATDAEFNIGVRFSLDQGYVEGEIDEVRLFAAAKTAAQIREDMFKDVGTSLTHFNSAADASTDGLVGRWGANEGTGSALSCSNSNLNGVIFDYNGGSPAAYTDAWAGAGTFTRGTSKLKMTGSSKNINYAGHTNIYDFEVTGTVTLNEITGGSFEWRLFGQNFTMGSGATLSSNNTEEFVFRSGFNGGTISLADPATNIANVYRVFCNGDGALSLPELTTKTVSLDRSGGNVTATGNLTLTTELNLDSGTTFNANGNTIAVMEMDLNSGGTLDLRNSTMNFSLTTDGDNIS